MTTTSMPRPLRFQHAVDAGDAVVDGDDDVGCLFARGQFHDFRREAVAILEAVGDDVVDRGAHGAQPAQGDGAGGGAVAIIVGHNGHFFAGLDGVGQEHGGGIDVQQAGRRHQAAQFTR